jgi:adenine-specific DNA-methyltransferase
MTSGDGGAEQRGVSGLIEPVSSRARTGNGMAITATGTARTGNLSPDQSSKALGSFYTDAQIAEFLVWWAIRSAQDRVMDPSFGGGVFLRAACERIANLGGQPATAVFGVEIDPEVCASITAELTGEFGVGTENLILSDFFRVERAMEGSVDVVVGNPPFVRYQRFSGEARQQALKRAAEQGVRLTELSSSWAPFLIYSIAMLKRRGRLAMVVPSEIGHAAYARPILEHLYRSFGEVTFLTFRKKLFPDLSEDTLLLLADDKGLPPAVFLRRDLAHSGLLAPLQSQGRLPLPDTERIDAQSLARGKERLIEYAIPKGARELYRELRERPFTHRLGELADVGIGYVTGANNFFHPEATEIQLWGIPDTFLRPAVRRGRSLSGLRFTASDWRDALKLGEAGYLLYIPAEADLPETVRDYLASGEAKGVSKTYKCRTRSPWFRVPHVYKPDAFLSYMSGDTVRLVANDFGAVAPNSLHILRLHRHTALTSDVLAALWQTSLTRLSAEVEGHALGGGMLKLEPTEAENVIVAVPCGCNGSWADLAGELDALIRCGDVESAQARADQLVLQDGLGLSESDCRLLRTAADELRTRRQSRGIAE